MAPAQYMMVAAHPWDLFGAERRLRRRSHHATGQPAVPVAGLPQPDLVVGGLRRLAWRLTGQR